MAEHAEHLARAIAHLQDARLDEAETALGLILEREPGHADALHFLGVLRHEQGRGDEAVALIRRSLAAEPANASAWNNLGNVLLSSGRLDDAVVAYERSVAAAPAPAVAADALNNLGVVYREQSRLADSEAMCRRAIAARDEFAESWYNLSLTLMRQGRIHEGLVASSRAIALWPRHLIARNEVIRALVLLGEREQAAALYREWLAEEPDNPVVLHQLAACLGGDSAPERASDAYVAKVFDAFASSFDAKLESLGYRAPALVVEALAAVAGAPARELAIVDAGCGTGLCGPLVRPWARTLAGCDLSVGMLRRARARGVYDVLHRAELVYYLATQPLAFDAIVCADTLCYFGRLDEAFAAARRSLRPGGWLVFTVEALGDDDPRPHALNATGRYAHRASYVAETLAAAGLAVDVVRRETLRLEAGLPVEGCVVRCSVQRPTAT